MYQMTLVDNGHQAAAGHQPIDMAVSLTSINQYLLACDQN